MKKWKHKFEFINLCRFLFQFSTPFSVQLNPQIGNPQNTNTNSNYNNKQPRNPNPFGNYTTINPTNKKRTHLIHKIRPQNPSNDGIKGIKWQRQKIIHFGSKLHIDSPRIGKCPRVLTRASHLCKNQQHQYRVGAASDKVAASDEYKKSCQVMPDEKDVTWWENKVVNKIH